MIIAFLWFASLWFLNISPLIRDVTKAYTHTDTHTLWGFQNVVRKQCQPTHQLPGPRGIGTKSIRVTITLGAEPRIPRPELTYKSSFTIITYILGRLKDRKTLFRHKVMPLETPRLTFQNHQTQQSILKAMMHHKFYGCDLG